MKKFLVLLCIVGVLALVSLLSPQASAGMFPSLSTFQSPLPEPGPTLPPVDVGGIEDWLDEIGALVAVGVVVELLKRFGVIKDGGAAKWATWGNIILFGVLTAVGAFGVDVSGTGAQNLYAILTQLGRLALMIFTTPAAYKGARALGIVSAVKGRGEA